MRRQQELHERGVQIRFIGRRDWRVPKRLIRRMDDAAELTRDNRNLVFTIAFNYGGRAEIVDAVQQLVADGVEPNQITEASITKRLYDPEMPDVDLMIRTSGEYRISNFLLWQIAYTEMWFTETLWPDFTRDTMRRAVADFQNRSRRYGGVTSA